MTAGKCKDVKVNDSIAYIGSEAGLPILDVNKPFGPEFISCLYSDKLVFSFMKSQIYLTRK
ncbi:MAG: hypothetical protein B6I19_11205 [Bacteroidetes bacterium 4572_114]|nr:MAG: hypothetical protein B6I19_11205 [Bacteroidetes bacterium 4572_114]